MNSIIGYVSALISLAALDSLWILVLAKSFYAKQMGFLFSKNPNLIPVALFYPIYALGVLLLCVLPSESWTGALWRGALLGLMAYSAYDLTNQATISGWPTIMTVVDVAWGITVTALSSLIAYLIISNIK